MNSKDVFNELSYFSPFISKYAVVNHLESMNRFSNYKEIYSRILQEDKKLNTATIVCRALSEGLKEGEISISDLDELLFQLIENKLFNSYLYQIKSTSVVQEDKQSFKHVLKSWGVPFENKILYGIQEIPSTMGFVISGHRVNDSGSIRLLLRDKELVKIREKAKDDECVIYATLLEFDFKHSLLHIRLKDVDNIESDVRQISTMEGRIENTLKFVESLTPNIEYSKISYFKESLFLLEEELLAPKREEAKLKLCPFEKHINQFSELVDSYFNPQYENEIKTQDYISNMILSIISSSLDLPQVGDVVGIQFRNQREEALRH